MRIIEINDSFTIPSSDAFSGLYILEGNGQMHAGEEIIPLLQGNQIFVPAGSGGLKIENDSAQQLKVFHFFGPE